MRKWTKIVAVIIAGMVAGSAYLLPAETFLSFMAAWLFLIPAASIVFLVLGLREYLTRREHRILVSIKPNIKMRELAHREAELKREKEILYKELRGRIKQE